MNLRYQWETETGQLLGFDGEACIAHLLYEQEASLFCVTKVYVDPSYRGQGLAALLLSEFERATRQEGRRLVATCPYAQKWIETLA